MDAGCSSGGILKLRELIEEHTSEIAYDFRERFGVSSSQIGHSVSYTEALLLINILSRDPSSWLSAARRKWDYPVSREWMVMANLVDVMVAANSKKKPKPSPRPWPKEGENRIGKKSQNRDEVIKRLNEMNRGEQDG